MALPEKPTVHEEGREEEGAPEPWEPPESEEDWDLELELGPPQPQFHFPIHLYKQYGKLMDPV